MLLYHQGQIRGWAGHVNNLTRPNICKVTEEQIWQLALYGLLKKTTFSPTTSLSSSAEDYTEEASQYSLYKGAQFEWAVW